MQQVLIDFRHNFRDSFRRDCFKICKFRQGTCEHLCGKCHLNVTFEHRHLWHMIVHWTWSSFIGLCAAHFLDAFSRIICGPRWCSLRERCGLIDRPTSLCCFCSHKNNNAKIRSCQPWSQSGSQFFHKSAFLKGVLANQTTVCSWTWRLRITNTSFRLHLRMLTVLTMIPIATKSTCSLGPCWTRAYQYTRSRWNSTVPGCHCSKESQEICQF